MEITCPSCASRYNFPEEHAKPGRKLRCSQCGHVFPLDVPAAEAPTAAAAEAPAAAPGKEPQKSSGMGLLLKVVLVLLLAAGGLGGGYFYYMASMNKAAPPTASEIEKKIERLTMRNVRQYYVDNEKVGKIFVIEGTVLNEFPTPKSLVTVEGAIYGKDKKPVAVKRQVAGSQLSLFQLQVLTEKEMESFMNNRLEILSKNVNVPSGGEVPFMVLFYGPPSGIVEFGVRIVDVQDEDKDKPK